jgi:membrane glycosyltransferase
MGQYLIKRILSTEAFLFLMVLFTALVTYLRMSSIVFSSINLLVIVWVLVFILLNLSVAHMFACSVYALFFNPSKIPDRYLSEIPPTAIIYSIRAESCGLFERINFTLHNNYLSNVDLWIVSGDAPDDFIKYEVMVLNRLKEKYGEKINYFHCGDPTKRKREMIEEWLDHHSNKYKYFVLCDADSMLPMNFVMKMLRKGEHPTNKDIAIFQSSISIINAKTYYSYFQQIGIKIGQRLYNASKQLVFKRALFWGHNALVRTEPFKSIDIPEKVLSHDIWETVYLNKIGYRTVFCLDVTSYEESPANYLEDKKRLSRWIKGNFETWSLMFQKDISMANRFYVFFGIYGYITNVIFFFWVYSGMIFEGTNIWKSMLKANYFMSIMIFSVIFLHKLVVCKGSSEIGRLVYEIFVSTIISLNSIFYISMIILTLPFQKKRKWIPMKKNPYETITWKDTAKEMWPGTLVGAISLYISLNYTPVWGLYSIPILVSLLLSIPVVYFTSLQRA